MSTLTIRPTTGYFWQSAGLAYTPAGDPDARLGDQSDSSYARASASVAGAWLQVRCGAPSIPSDEFVCRVAARARYSGVNGKVHSIIAFRDGDGVPTSGVSFYAGSASATEVEPGYSSRKADGSGWNASDVAAMRVFYNTTDVVSDSARAYLYELAARIYTSKLATATPSNRTETTSVFAAIPVANVVEIDTWQAGTPAWMLLRRVTVEVQVESGGTGIGTGTVMANETFDFDYSASGTFNETCTLTTAIANGTYKIYTRAIRYRDSDTSNIESDQTGAWSSAATLSMTVPLPNAPTVNVTADQANDRMNVSVTPVATSGYSSPVIEVQRSNDGGVTYSTVRGMSAVAGTFGVAQDCGYDYEALRATSVLYRARISAFYSGVLNVGPWSGDDGTIAAVGWNLKCPETPALNVIGLGHAGKVETSADEDMGVFRPLDRSLPVVVAGVVSGWDGAVSCRTNTAAEWAALKALIRAQKVLLLEDPFGESKYIRISGKIAVSLGGTASRPRREISFPYVECEAP